MIFFFLVWLLPRSLFAHRISKWSFTTGDVFTWNCKKSHFWFTAIKWGCLSSYCFLSVHWSGDWKWLRCVNLAVNTNYCPNPVWMSLLLQGCPSESLIIQCFVLFLNNMVKVNTSEHSDTLWLSRTLNSVFAHRLRWPRITCCLGDKIGDAETHITLRALEHNKGCAS